MNRIRCARFMGVVSTAILAVNAAEPTVVLDMDTIRLS